MTTQTANEIAQFRISRSQFVRTYTDDQGRLIWSKVEHGSMRDLTRENSAGVLIDFHRLFVPHGERNPIEKIAEHQAAVAELVDALCEQWSLLATTAIPLNITEPDRAKIYAEYREAMNGLNALIAKHRAPDAFEAWAEGLIDEADCA